MMPYTNVCVLLCYIVENGRRSSSILPLMHRFLCYYSCTMLEIEICSHIFHNSCDWNGKLEIIAGVRWISLKCQNHSNKAAIQLKIANFVLCWPIAMIILIHHQRCAIAFGSAVEEKQITIVRLGERVISLAKMTQPQLSSRSKTYHFSMLLLCKHHLCFSSCCCCLLFIIITTTYSRNEKKMR